MATAGVTSHQWDDAAIRGTVKSAFRATYKESTPVWHDSGFERDTSDSPYEEFTSYSGIGLAPRKEELQQVAIDVPKQNYTLRVNMLEYAIMIPVSEAALRFLKRGKMKVREFVKPAEMVAESIAQTNEVLAADIFGNAFDSNFVGMDGVSAVSASHKLGRGGTSSNYLGKVAFSQSSLEAAIIQGNRFPDESGLPIGVKPGQRRLLLPPEYEFEAERILNSTLQSDNANNAVNALKGKNLKTAINRYLPSTTNWFVINEGEKQGLLYLAETEADARDFGDDRTHTMFFQGYQNVAFAPGLNWRRLQGSDF